MASRKKLTPQKVVGRTHQAFQNSLQVLAFFSSCLLAGHPLYVVEFFTLGHMESNAMTERQ